MIEDIEDYREEQYRDYSIYLGTPDVIELIKCNGCCEHVEDTEIEMFDMKEYNNAGLVEYCKECIKIYKEENQ